MHLFMWLKRLNCKTKNSELSLEIETESIHLIYSLKSRTALKKSLCCDASAVVASSHLEEGSRRNERVKEMNKIEKKESGVSLMSLLEGLSRSLGEAIKYLTCAPRRMLH